MAIATVISTLGALKSLGEKLGWWGQLTWPTEIDKAIAQLEELEGRRIPHLHKLRDDAHTCMITAERSYFGGHTYWVGKFKEAVKRCGEAITKEAEDYEARLKAEEEARKAQVAGVEEKVGWIEFLKKYGLYVGIGTAISLLGIAVWRKKKR